MLSTRVAHRHFSRRPQPVGSIDNLRRMTDPDRFWQVHRGTIVNVDAAFGVMCEDAEK